MGRPAFLAPAFLDQTRTDASYDAAMRIFYGVNAQQQGHFARAAQIVPELQRRGHIVQTLTSGLPLDSMPSWASQRHEHFPGLPYRQESGATDLAGTARDWLADLPATLRHRRRVKRLARDFAPDLVISDFEFYTGSPGLGLDCPIVSACRQVAVLDPNIPLPPHEARGRGLTRTVIRLFAMGADRRLAYHFAPESARCLPPMLRTELTEIEPTAGDALLVYNSQHFGAGGDAGSLVTWADDRNVRVKAYGYRDEPRGLRGRVEFRPASREGMLADLAACRAVATTAGFALPLEAAVLGKPCLTVPLPGQWEQSVNAWQLEQLGYSRASDRWDFDAACDLPPPTVPPEARRWLLTPLPRIVDALLAAARSL